MIFGIAYLQAFLIRAVWEQIPRSIQRYVGQLLEYLAQAPSMHHLFVVINFLLCI